MPKSPRRLAHPNPRGFEAVDTLVFDLDNTLYPSHCNLFAQVDRNMGAYVAKLLYRQIGTVLPPKREYAIAEATKIPRHLS